MIEKKTYELDHIKELQLKYKVDPGLVERALFAFGLLEALARTGMEFVFKGGSCLMLLFQKPYRLSTDIDIIVKPETDIDTCIRIAGEIFPFIRKEEQIRKGRNNIIKRHFKFFYYSPLMQKEYYILLDAVFMEPPYERLLSVPVKNDFLITNGKEVFVNVPDIDCILGDKLTAFAPHTTGIPFGTGKELEIAKQMFDVSMLTANMSNQFLITSSFRQSVHEEADFRSIDITEEDVLLDVMDACITIISRGFFNREEYSHYVSSIRSLSNFVISRSFSAETAAVDLCPVVYLAACILTDSKYLILENPDRYLKKNLPIADHKKFNHVRKKSLIAYAYLFHAFNLLAKTERFRHRNKELSLDN